MRPKHYLLSVAIAFAASLFPILGADFLTGVSFRLWMLILFGGALCLFLPMTVLTMKAYVTVRQDKLDRG